MKQSTQSPDFRYIYRKNYDYLGTWLHWGVRMTDVDFRDYVEFIKDWPEQGKAVIDISRFSPMSGYKCAKIASYQLSYNPIDL